MGVFKDASRNGKPLEDGMRLSTTLGILAALVLVGGGRAAQQPSAEELLKQSLRQITDPNPFTRIRAPST